MQIQVRVLLQHAKRGQGKLSIVRLFFTTLERIVKVNTASNSQPVKRLHVNRSPSGSTPDPKKAKDIVQEPQEQKRRQPASRARKSLFELNATWAEQESLEDAVVSSPLQLFGRLSSFRTRRQNRQNIFT